MSLHLQNIESGNTVKVEIRDDQRSNIAIICRVRKAGIITEETLPDSIIQLTLRKN